MPTRYPLAALGLNLLVLLPGLALISGPRADGPRKPPPPPPLFLQWSRTEPLARPAWPDQPRLQFEAAPRPVAAGERFLLASAVTDRVTCHSAATGEELWAVQADGPVRLPPAVWENRVYFGSDDGHLYCVDLRSGEVAWKFRGGPSGRLLLGNERLISTWPVRGAPVVVPEGGGRASVYCAAGIWPFMGVFLHALDARTGAVRWSNSGDGAMYIKQPHQADAFAGVAPQGILAVHGDRLLVPSGRSVAACYDRHTGKLLHFRLADSSKLGGGPEVQPGADVFLNGAGAFHLSTGDYLGVVGEPSLLAGPRLYAMRGADLAAHDLTGAAENVREAARRAKEQKAKGKKVVPSPDWLPPPQLRVSAPKATCMTLTAGRLFVGSPGSVRCFALSGDGLPVTTGPVLSLEGTPAHLAFVADTLLVGTREGKVLAFGTEETAPKHHPLPTPEPPAADESTRQAAGVLTASGVKEGYALVWGAGRLSLELARQSALRVIAVDHDEGRRDQLRAAARAAGLPADKLAVLPGRPGEIQLPPYLASLATAEVLPDGGPSVELLRSTYHTLRPYGGVACWPAAARQAERVKNWLADTPELAQGKATVQGEWLLVSREGALPGAGEWTHQHADAANTRVSRDRVVKAPLGLLWFGGPGNQSILPRHGHGPQPHVQDGRLFIEGVDSLRALDIYTGRLLWETSLPGVGASFDYLPHQAGSNATGTNYITTREGIYVVHRDGCVRLDPATGAITARFGLPVIRGEKTPPAWAFLTAVGDYLVVGYNPAPAPGPKSKGPPQGPSSSKHLAVLDRATGKLRWSVTATQAFRHNAICAGGGRLFAIDRKSEDFTARFPRLADRADQQAQLLCLDLEDGTERWSTRREVFGTWLSYSAEKDVLVEAGRVARDTLRDESKGMRAYRATSGAVLWHRPEYLGPAMIHGTRILKNADSSATSGNACDLLTGKTVLRDDPVTGKKVEWRWQRTYGCNTPMASEHLLTFRSGAAGYYDLAGDGGTANLGGFRSGCTNNLVVAGGLLVAPDYTRNCTCSYQNQTSVALVPADDVELWTFQGGKGAVSGQVQQVGINLGAPGNRRTPDGLLWLEYPPVGGPAPRPAVSVTPPETEWFRAHSSTVEGGGLNWVAASGARGLRTLTVAVGVAGDRPRPCTVSLHFLEPDGLRARQRRFSVALQGKTVTPSLDVSDEAGGPNRPLVKVYRGVQVGAELKVELEPEDCERPAAVLSGVEIRFDRK